MNDQKEARKQDSGFTLIEILIVVILLGILASIIMPQIFVSNDDAKLNSLRTNLCNMKSAIDLYYYQHGNRYPGQYDEANGTAALSDAGDAADAFIAQLTQYSNANGKTSVNSGTTEYNYGPYLKGGLPINPFNNANTVTCDTSTTDVTARTAVPDDGTGWRFYTKTGILIANDSTDHDDF
jgi:prepilin-type N-terminal cleavage/methylation domain-containing protein